MRVVLTDSKIAALRPAKPGRRYDLADALVPNLLVRVTSGGGKSFMFRHRFGKPHAARRLLGVVGAMTLAAARDKARAWHALIDRGIDPAQHARSVSTPTPTFLTVAEAYFAHIRRN